MALYTCLLPLLFSLWLACYQWLNWSQYTGLSLSYARLNSYIYAHSYGALLLVLFVGIRIGQTTSYAQQKYRLALHLSLAMCAWLSLASFADLAGMTFLSFCWMVYAISHRFFTQHAEQNQTSVRPETHVNFSVIGLLIALILINH
ncbi:hypothetical protein [Marinicella litoralis]|uniref:Uncharacterized protein n=2 Tax=Marinicella litoralis TaxID=644220 RepID=A0A4R6XLY6_9GAMM|nr:hypothetical protein [Marinicella litoralis]TDR19359.1 hypothetical protein C8D91_1908 [Marinicella litoralis]